eukprot:scaffold91021_cov21-Phaeocystis_antarctica.AAC.1
MGSAGVAPGHLGDQGGNLGNLGGGGVGGGGVGGGGVGGGSLLPPGAALPTGGGIRVGAYRGGRMQQG